MLAGGWWMSLGWTWSEMVNEMKKAVISGMCCCVNGEKTKRREG